MTIKDEYLATANIYRADLPVTVVLASGETICFAAGDELSTTPDVYADIAARYPGVFVFVPPRPPAPPPTLWARVRRWLARRRG